MRFHFRKFPCPCLTGFPVSVPFLPSINTAILGSQLVGKGAIVSKVTRLSIESVQIISATSHDRFPPKGSVLEGKSSYFKEI